MGQGLAEWVVTAPDGEQTVLQMAYFDRSQAPVVMEIGPVLALEDVAGGKVCALASRVEPRDYADTARMLDRYSPAELIGFARRLDPSSWWEFRADRTAAARLALSRSRSPLNAFLPPYCPSKTPRSAPSPRRRTAA
jgi:hypothetical protein